MLAPLLTADQIQSRVAELAKEIRSVYRDEPILLIVVLKGSYVFAADLARAIGEPVEIDFVQLSSYGNGKQASGIVQIRKDADISCEGRHVLVVEDIVDSGATLKHLRELLSTRRPKTLQVVSLLSKPKARQVDVPIEFLGFEVPNEFVVGYGLDFAEKYRSLPYVAILRED